MLKRFKNTAASALQLKHHLPTFYSDMKSLFSEASNQKTSQMKGQKEHDDFLLFSAVTTFLEIFSFFKKKQQKQQTRTRNLIRIETQ